MNRCLQEADVPKSMTKRKTTLIQKDPTSKEPPQTITDPKRAENTNGTKREEIYDSLINRGLFKEEQIGCFKESRDTGKLLYIDQHILNESNPRPNNPAMVWIDYKKV